MIVITAPSGNIGHQVLQNVLESGLPIRVIEREPHRIAPEIRDRIEIVQGSHKDARVLDRAFEGADTVFWLCPPDPKATSVRSAYVDFTRPATDALRRYSVPRVISISALGRGTPQAASAGHVTASLAMDDLIAATGISFRALTMPSFMDNLRRQIGPIRTQGVFFSPIAADRLMPTCATKDIAAAAAALLTDPVWNGQDHKAVMGPENLSFDDMARIMSEVLGKTVRVQQISGEAYKANLLANGMSDAMAQGMLDMALAKNAGLDNAEPRDNKSSSPTHFSDWCEHILKPAVFLASRSSTTIKP